jgi:membrane-associated protease RseP (regulator of RpoE activity)
MGEVTPKPAGRRSTPAGDRSAVRTHPRADCGRARQHVGGAEGAARRRWTVFRPAKFAVTGPSVGFGPELIGFTDQYGARWKLAPLLVGGSCDFSDQTSKDAEGSEATNKRLHPLREASPLERALVYAAGPVFNLAFAALLWVAIVYHRGLLPFISDDEAVFGLPTFLAMFSISLAFFNLIPIPSLDGGQLVLIGLETLRGSTIANEEQLIRAGSWITAVLTIVMFVLFLPRATNGTLWNF